MTEKNSTEPIISIRHVWKYFGQLPALQDVSLDIAPGERVVIIGPSGSGKSTLLRSINRLEEIDGGSIIVNGQDINDKANNINEMRRNLGMVFQQFNLFPHKTVLQNLTLAPRKLLNIPKAEAETMALKLLKKVGISDKANVYPAMLSGGQQQRVALARMLAARPGILMLDEPFSALDAHLKSVLEQNLVSLFDAFRGTILYVSHDIDEALRFCDRIAVVESGHIMEMGTGDDLVNRPQSQAGIKLSGCKNATQAERRGPRTVWLPKWGVQVDTAAEVPEGVKCLGVRAFYLQRVDGPGRNCFRMRVDRVSDSRFERTALLGFLDRSPEAAPAVERTEDEMKYLHQHLFWRVDKLKTDAALLPHEGEELWIRIPDDKLYLVQR